MALTKLNARSASALDATILTGNLPAISWASLTGISAGITTASVWRLTTSFAGDVEPIASNLEQVDDASYENLGSAMVESSGVFTFPSTGYWMVGFNAQQASTAAAGRGVGRIQVTINNSSYDLVCEFSVDAEASGDYNNASGHALVNVTNVSNVKVKFDYIQIENDSNLCGGNSSANVTFMSFTRLGDT